MDEGQARNPNTTYNGCIMEFWKFVTEVDNLQGVAPTGGEGETMVTP